MIAIPDMKLLPGVHPIIFPIGADSPIPTDDGTAIALLDELKRSHGKATLEDIEEYKGRHPTDIIGLDGKVYNYNITANDSYVCIAFMDITPYHQLLSLWERDFNVMRTARDTLIDLVKMKDCLHL